MWVWGRSRPQPASCTVLLEARFCPFSGKDTDVSEAQLLGHVGFHVLNQKHMCTRGLD